MTFVLSEEVRTELQRLAREQRRSMTGVIEYLILNPANAGVEQLEEAFENGREKGYEDGRERGYEDGRERGYEDAREGFGDDLLAEYERGYEDGKQAEREREEDETEE